MADTREHGPLPRLLIALTVVTGLVDAFSYVTLGHVFVANMTGNVVFFGFALAGVGQVSVVASLLAILACRGCLLQAVDPEHLTRESFPVLIGCT